MNKNHSHLINHAEHSVGGIRGHVLRRMTHISIIFIPILYYTKGHEIASLFTLEPKEFVASICLIFIIFELIRLKLGFIVLGQREYESKQISALAWGAFSVSLALIFSPEGDGDGLKSGSYGIPLIFGLSIVDPVMGEIKRIKKDIKLAIFVGLLTSFVIWISCHFWIGTNIFAAIILAPLTVLGEIPSSKFIDDNATMILLPLSVLLLMSPFL